LPGNSLAECALRGRGWPNAILSRGSRSPSDSLTVPAGVLNNADRYVLQVAESVTRDGTRNTAHHNEGAISRAEFNFSVLPPGAPPGPIFIPTADSSGIFHFSISGIDPDITYDLDPSVATGYIYSTGPGDPNFASVQLPDIGNPASYSLYLWDGSKFVFDALLAPETLFDFGPAGVDRFEILGIDPSLGVDPSNPTAFVTALTFAAAGDFTGTMTPIVADVAEPGSIALLGIGLAAFGRLRRPRLGAVPGLRRGELVGQCHGGELSGLAGEQAREPRCGGRTAGGPFTRGLDPRVGSRMGAVAPQHQ
jgi:hypothetical protein